MKTNMKTHHALCGLLPGLLLLAAGSVQASLIIPSSYSFDIAPNNVGPYYPDSGGELTDGLFGPGIYFNNPTPWAGWRQVNPTITFSFASAVSIGTVSIDFDRYQFHGIYLPTSVVIGSTTFNLTGTELGDGTRGPLTFNGSWSVTSLAVTLNHRIEWTFADEVQFETTPEPTPAALLLGSGAMLLLRRRRAAAR